MKRTLLVLTLVLALGIGTMAVFAETTRPEKWVPGWGSENFTEEERTEKFNERNEFRKEELKKALANGEINEAEFKEWEEHFAYMEDFQKKNGCFGGGFGRGKGMMRGHHGQGGMRGNRF